MLNLILQFSGFIFRYSAKVLQLFLLKTLLPQEGTLAACGGWSNLHPPTFSREKVRRCPVGKTARAAALDLRGCFYKRLPRPVEIRNRLSFYYRCRSSGGNAWDWLFYRDIQRLPCVRGAVPVRTLGLRGCNR